MNFGMPHTHIYIVLEYNKRQSKAIYTSTHTHTHTPTSISYHKILSIRCTFMSYQRNEKKTKDNNKRCQKRHKISTQKQNEKKNNVNIIAFRLRRRFKWILEVGDISKLSVPKVLCEGELCSVDDMQRCEHLPCNGSPDLSGVCAPFNVHHSLLHFIYINGAKRVEITTRHTHTHTQKIYAKDISAWLNGNGGV